MAEREIKWLHSHGWDNKDPNYDLGGDPSRFEIAVLPANNLFDDITPEEAKTGWTDYRCFYIQNKYLDTDYDVTLASTAASCTTIMVGSVIQNDQQMVTFQGPSPSPNGYFICKLTWGPELTVYWSGSYSAMAADMQAKIALVQYCSGVTVSLVNTFPNDGGAQFLVTFGGQLMNRKMGLIEIIQNNLFQGGTREYRVNNSGSPIAGGFNYTGATKVRVDRPISVVPSVGLIHIPFPITDVNDPHTWPYMHLSYSSYNAEYFMLSQPIPSVGPGPFPLLGNNDEVWVDMPSVISYTAVNISKVRDGSPINQIAEVIEVETIKPMNWSTPGTNFHVGLIKPSEGFFVWVQRITPMSATGCQDGFSITLNATRVS